MTIYYPLKRIKESGIIEYECIPYDVFGTWKAFSSFKDKIAFFSKCFLSKEKCIQYCNIKNADNLPDIDFGGILKIKF